MSKRNRSQPHGRGAAARQEKRKQALPWSVRLHSMSDLLLHPVSPDERPWKFLLPVLALAFVARAAIALSGDFVLHPDEIMQYLESAHRLVFGNGVTYWEVLLRCAFVAGAWVGRWRLEAIRPRRPRSACLVRRRRQARVLRDFPAHSGGHVLFCPVAFWRNCGTGHVPR